MSPEYPLSSLPRFYRKRERIEAAGHEDLRDVPDEFLSESKTGSSNARPPAKPILRCRGAAADLAPYGFPAYFLDFETAMFAVPIWKGTRPYQQIPFQFSLHILAESGPPTPPGFWIFRAMIRPALAPSPWWLSAASRARSLSTTPASKDGDARTRRPLP